MSLLPQSDRSCSDVPSLPSPTTPKSLGMNAGLLEALLKIAAIENQMHGPDWGEIDEARAIARAALALHAKSEGQPAPAVTKASGSDEQE
jgi:hypothetical protein